MKTTIDIADHLLLQLKREARRENRTVRELVEEALRRYLSEKGGRKKFRLRRNAFKGKGLQPGIQEGDWERVRDIIYGVG
jgi:Arc/MetJ family transcription regulator